MGNQKIEIIKTQSNTIIKATPYKNWLAIFLLIPLTIIFIAFVLLYVSLLIYEKKYFLIVFIGIFLTGIYVVINQLIWIFFGVIEIEIAKNEIVIHKKNLQSSKTKYYNYDDIASSRIENLFNLKGIKHIPLVGGIYFDLLSESKKDSYGLVINFRNKDIEILNNLTHSSGEFIINELKNAMMEYNSQAYRKIPN